MSSFDFIPGQRWISNSESELGLGLIQSLDHRTITIDFPASNEIRTYAIEQAPLSRVSFAVGDSIKNKDNEKFNITALQEHEGIISYEVNDAEGNASLLCETELSAAIKLNRPQDRLFTAQFDPEKAFLLRHDTLKQKHILSTSSVNGLYGVRMSLIPHQLYIAHEVASRPSPRVLLADEVGLGKTIEAGLILHHQLISGRAQRILIVVPDALLHQWLVEMLRRFNLKFSLFNEERCLSIDEENGVNLDEESDSLDQELNPFQSEQLVLCSLDFLMQNPKRHQQIIDGEWDTLIIDEAHHLKWEVNNVSPEYQLIDVLAQNTASVLLLTATPEQLGPSSHFARLRLLDPHRFHDLETFLAEESHYTTLAETAELLIDDKPLEKHDIKVLEEFIPHDNQDLLTSLTSSTGEELSALKQKIVDLLIDQHGTGRVLFRNTRHAIKGFPERRVNGYALDASGTYASLFSKIFTSEEKKEQFSLDFKRSYAELMLTPEVAYQSLKDLGISILKDAPHWSTFDPRVTWIINLLKELKHKKVLVICAHAQTALELEDILKNKHAIRASVFHENLSIIERDRAAAYFADEEIGAQVLICSEIGSEGRNFQFSHNLVLFDLPLNPDLLEQRIGRLDRIGQKEIIQIHIPYIKESAQEILFHWYKEGLNAFTHTCPAGQGMVAQLGKELNTQLEQATYNVDNVISLLDKAKPLYTELNNELQKGRDRLLEMNAFRKPVAEKLVNAIHDIEDNNILEDYMMRICDTYGVEQTDHSSHSYVLHPGNHMLTPHFPELPDDGVTITFDRETALVHEDRLFMSWEHPMVSGVMDMVVEGEHGNVAFSIVKNRKFKTGTVLLEMLFVVQCIAPSNLQIDRFMPTQLIRLVMDKDNTDYSDEISFEQCKSLVPSIDAHTCQQIVAGHRENLRTIIAHAESQLSLNMPALISSAKEQVEEQLGEQISRLRSLQQTNPNVRDDEIKQLADEKDQLLEYIQHPQLRLDALRLIIAG
ncbi:MAG: RNA polymerase-associated protein RapA [Gammaproteobacteria bacterium]|nr:RNA polymerase-associated protein RapA [Gammaproteobacteria bacterium]